MIRRLPGPDIYLTFDDGPDPVGTPRVLEVLSRHKAKATFFVIGNQARKYPDLFLEIKGQGHALGNHSPDHDYARFFGGDESLREWIRAGSFPDSVGFRPPAGVITPPLLRACRNMNEPVVLWSERFYDAVIPWGAARARRSAARLAPGSIVLLHDRQSPKRIENFCGALDTYLAGLRDRGLFCSAMSREQLLGV